MIIVNIWVNYARNDAAGLNNENFILRIGKGEHKVKPMNVVNVAQSTMCMRSQ